MQAAATAEKEEMIRLARGELATSINELDRTKHRLEKLVEEMIKIRHEPRHE